MATKAIALCSSPSDAILIAPMPTYWYTSREHTDRVIEGAHPPSDVSDGRIGATLLGNLASQPTAIRSERTAWQRCNAIAIC